MNLVQKHKLPSVLRWGCFNLMKNNLGLSKTTLWATGSGHIDQNPRFYGRKRICESENGQTMDGISHAVRKEAQAALLEYLHSTRSLQFMDAENMSRNSPQFLEKFLEKFESLEDIGRSITRFLRYNPINEFEPFFESIGLIPSEYSSFLPRNIFFLTDDKLLLENYYVLCNYGFPRNRIGKIYKEEAEVFQYDYGILQSRLQSLQEMGLHRSTVIKIVSSSPYLLKGNANREFFMVLEKLKTFGIEYGWFGGNLLEGDSYNWSSMLEFLCLLSKMGCSKVQMEGLVSRHPGLLCESSGSTSLSLIGLMTKFGATESQIISMFLEFEQSNVGKFVWNLRQCYHFLVEVEMDVQEIGRIVCSHPVLLGSCSLKKVNSVLVVINTGKRRLCEMIISDPQVLKNWVLGSRVKPLKTEKDIPEIKRTKFLLDLGFVENSNEMRKARKDFRGKAGELQERFDCLVNAGIDRGDVLEMLKTAPQILNQSKDLIEMKIDFLVNGLGYPVSYLVVFPAYLSYTIQRINLRFSMYNWLVDQGLMDPDLALSTIIACSDAIFIRVYVNLHPGGPEIWEKLKKEINSD